MLYNLLLLVYIWLLVFIYFFFIKFQLFIYLFYFLLFFFSQDVNFLKFCLYIVHSHASLLSRLKMFGFWNEEGRLSSDTLPRLTQLLPVLYSPSSEHHFLHHSTNLLLELTSRSPDFNRSIFDSPLSECKFEVGEA